MRPLSLKQLCCLCGLTVHFCVIRKALRTGWFESDDEFLRPMLTSSMFLGSMCSAGILMGDSATTEQRQHSLLLPSMEQGRELRILSPPAVKFSNSYNKPPTQKSDVIPSIATKLTGFGSTFSGKVGDVTWRWESRCFQD